MGGEDKIIWKSDFSGTFSVKLAYEVLWNESHPQSVPSLDMWSVLWKLKLPRKLCFFLWKLCHNGILVRAELRRRNIQVPPNCPFCLHQEETLDHLFKDCDFTRAVWFASAATIRISSIEPLNVRQWTNVWLSNKDIHWDTGHAFYTNSVVTLWAIWTHRNACVFKKSQPNPGSVVSHIRTYSAQILTAFSIESIPKESSLSSRESLIPLQSNGVQSIPRGMGQSSSFSLIATLWSSGNPLTLAMVIDNQ